MDAVERAHVKQDVRTIAEARHQEGDHEEEDHGYEELVVHTDDHRQADRMMSHGWVMAIDHAENENGYDAPLTETGAAIYHCYEQSGEEGRTLLDDDPERFIARAIDPE